ncbi:MAG: lysophospholipid acyltransferase family protein [Candidatus Cryptobacteroides sp.]
MSKLGVKVVHSLVSVLGRLPLGFHYAFGRCLAFLAKNVVRYRYDVVMINLARSFPEKKHRELKEIADRFYSHFGDIFAEAIWFSAATYKRLYDSRIAYVENPGLLNECFRSSPSVTVLFSHCGNWELLGGILAYCTNGGLTVDACETDVKVVYKRLHSKFSNDFFLMNRITPLGPGGDECEVETGDILRYAIKRKDKKSIYIYIADQSPYMGSYDVGEFMHQPTKAMLGGAKVAHKLGHSVLYMGMKVVERGRYAITFEPLCHDASKEDPEKIIRKYFDLLERDIKEQPHNWLWTHNRWKK